MKLRPLAQIVAAFAAGAAAMYWFDPAQGRRRRSRLAARLGMADRGADAFAAPDTGPLAHGVTATDAQLREHIRTRLGRLVSHPRAIDVAVQEGVVRLSGHVLAKERDGLLTQVHQMPGVVRLVNAMTAHDTPQGIVRLEAAPRFPVDVPRP